MINIFLGKFTNLIFFFSKIYVKRSWVRQIIDACANLMEYCNFEIISNINIENILVSKNGDKIFIGGLKFGERKYLNSANRFKSNF